tara:strand:+ start:622 stop:741 length:120 start_codon:yes stop_codon:yes gene_type:complete
MNLSTSETAMLKDYCMDVFEEELYDGSMIPYISFRVVKS